MTASGGEAPPPVHGLDGEVRPAKRKKLRKEEIVAEATRLFAERGYEGTSMGDLAERVGLRKASLFHHFESKDVLYAAVLGDLLRAAQNAIVAAAAMEGSFAERLDALTDAITAMLGADPYIARLLVREAMDWGPVMREHLGSAIQEVLVAALVFTKAGQEAGVFDDTLEADHLIMSLVGVYTIPFVIDRTVERFTGSSPFAGTFVEQRRRAVRDQVRALILAKP